VVCCGGRESIEGRDWRSRKAQGGVERGRIFGENLVWIKGLEDDLRLCFFVSFLKWQHRDPRIRIVL
jgi:hypothetical protein